MPLLGALHFLIKKFQNLSERLGHDLEFSVHGLDFVFLYIPVKLCGVEAVLPDRGCNRSRSGRSGFYSIYK